MSFPFIALFFWPVVVMVLFGKYKASLALLISVVAGYLLLPVNTKLDLPLLPGLNKNSVPALTALFMVFILKPARADTSYFSSWIPQNNLARLLLLILMASPLLTVMTNSDTLRYGPEIVHGLVPYDGFSATLNAVTFLLPFFLAYKLLARPEQHRVFLVALTVAGLIYSLPTLYEVRMSPQLNRMIYGFFPHDWQQHVRSDGFRPVVFLKHGLGLSLFFSGTVLAALGCLRISQDKRKLYAGATIWLLVVLVLTKSLGALVVAVFFIPFVYFCKVRTQLLAAAIIAGCVLTYPVLRGAGFVPIETVLSLAENIDPQRASSLRTRLKNEDALLEKALQRPLFGWGGWGRSRIFNEKGQDVTISDGEWVIIIGFGGWLRYLAQFGLLAAPLILLARRSGMLNLGLETSVLAIVLAGNLVDLIPNSGLTPITWLLAGALWGRLAVKTSEVSDLEAGPETGTTRRRTDFSRTQKPAVPDSTPVYTRQTKVKQRLNKAEK